jgi:hypothetical protein
MIKQTIDNILFYIDLCKKLNSPVYRDKTLDQINSLIILRKK